MTLSARFRPTTDLHLAAEREQADAHDQGSERNGQAAGAGGGQRRCGDLPLDRREIEPSSGGAKLAAVTVTMNAGDTKVKTVSLTGTGVAATYLLSPTSINFGAVAVGNASSTRTVVLTNTGSVAMPIKSILLTGTNPGDFVSGHICGTEVPVGGNCQINVSFQPASGGSKTAKITMTPGAGASAKSVSLSGIGSEPPISSATPLDIPTGAASEEMAFDGATLWVANPYSQSVSKIRVADGTLLANIGIGPFPRGIAFDGTDIWVTTENDNRIHRMRTSDGAVTLSANVGGYPIVAVYAGGYIWTVNHSGHSVSKVALNGTVVGTYPTVNYPHSATTDGSYLYVASSGFAEITKLSLATGATAATFATNEPAGSISFDGTDLWLLGQTNLFKIHPVTGGQLLAFTFGQSLVGWNQNLFPVAGGIWVADFQSGKIRKLSLSSGAVIDEITQLATGPQGIAYAGGHLWVAMGQQGKVVRY
jgi:outer membrane protein assembly factor BamB